MTHYRSDDELRPELPDLSDTKIGEVSFWAKEQVLREEKVAKLKEALKEAEKELREVSEERLPEAMEEVGMEKFLLSNGTWVRIETFYSGRIGKSEKEQEAAFTWLRENNHEDLIKNVVSVQFGRGEDDKADNLISDLSKQGHYSHTRKWVEPMTLKAFIKEQVSQGKPIPFDTFNVFVGRKTKLTRN